MSKRPTTTTSPRSATTTTRSSRRSTSCAPQDAPKAHASEARTPPRSLHYRANSPCPRSSRVAAPDDLRERRPREGGLLQSPGERVTTAQPPGLLLLVRSERSMPELSDARLDGRKGACPLVRTTPAAVSRCMERGVVALLFGSAAGSGFAGRGSGLLLLDGGGPTAEEVERFVRFGAGLRCEGQEVQAGIGGELHHLEGEGEIADDGVVEALDAG